ncbi:unnamed protein product [Lymnaea stagnalis]|uniref:Uncharacterized protein n=1 Tax=Lymnaea stagnalis TaxID=6523 RepID=A0AAV2GY13_LYMST
MGPSGRLFGISLLEVRFCLKNHQVSSRVFCRYFTPSHAIHTTTICLKQTKKNEISSEPYKFTISAANIPTLPKSGPINKYQPYIVTVSLAIFMIYFFFLREENDIDQQLNTSLFRRVPNLEEPHLRQAIPQMRDSGMDTTEAEIRLRDIVAKRQEQEKKH